MSKLTSLNALLIQQIQDLYSAESQLVEALPEMAGAATNTALKDALTAHLEETRKHAERLGQIATILGVSPRGSICKGLKGLLAEGAEALGEDGDPTIRDLALVAAAQRVEHYEISCYGTIRAIAETLKLDEVVDLIQLTLEEESATDLILTRIAEHLLPAAMGEIADA
jgi:ferritin-like metal-binding protein YciE